MFTLLFAVVLGFQIEPTGPNSSNDKTIDVERDEDVAPAWDPTDPWEAVVHEIVGNWQNKNTTAYDPEEGSWRRHNFALETGANDPIISRLGDQEIWKVGSSKSENIEELDRSIKQLRSEIAAMQAQIRPFLGWVDRCIIGGFCVCGLSLFWVWLNVAMSGWIHRYHEFSLHTIIGVSGINWWRKLSDKASVVCNRMESKSWWVAPPTVASVGVFAAWCWSPTVALANMLTLLALACTLSFRFLVIDLPGPELNNLQTSP